MLAFIRFYGFTLQPSSLSPFLITQLSDTSVKKKEMIFQKFSGSAASLVVVGDWLDMMVVGDCDFLFNIILIAVRTFCSSEKKSHARGS